MVGYSLCLICPYFLATSADDGQVSACLQNNSHIISNLIFQIVESPVPNLNVNCNQDNYLDYFWYTDPST